MTQDELEEAFNQMASERKEEFNSAMECLTHLLVKSKFKVILKKNSTIEQEINPYPDKYSFTVRTSNVEKAIQEFLKVPNVSVLKISIDGLYNEQVVLQWDIKSLFPQNPQEVYEISFEENRDN